MTAPTTPSGTTATPFLLPLAAGLAIACLSAFYAISYAVVLFDGPTEALRGHGITVLLASAVIYGLAGAWFGSIPGTWWGNQTVCVAVLALGGQSIADRAAPLPPGALEATMLAYLTASTLLTGALFVAVGTFRLAEFVRIIPHPVIGGFLGATGLFLAYRSGQFVSGAATPADMLAPDAVLKWAPVIGGALALVAIQMARPSWRVLIPALATGVAGFYAYLWLTGMSFAEAKDMGLLLSAPGSVADAGAGLARGSLALVDRALLTEAIPTIATTAAIGVLALLMNVSGIELMTGRPARLNRDFRDAGAANLAVGILGGVPGFHSASTTHLAVNQFGRPSTAQCLVAVAVLVALLLGGLPLVGFLPSALVALMLAFIGCDILWRWIVTEARAMSWSDRAIVWLILAATMLFGFAAAIAIGLVFSTLLFALAYSRIEVLRSASTGGQRFSGTERGEAQIAELLRHGAETRIYELQGYLFFGTAERLYARVTRVIEDADSPIRRMVFDFRRVAGIDASAAQMFRKLARHARERDLALAFADMSSDAHARLAAAEALDGVLQFPALAEALTWVEDEVLAAVPGLDARIDPDMRDILDRLDAACAPAGLPRRTMAPGETLFGEGGASNSLAVIESGALAATIALPDGTKRQVARFLPGAVVGEIGLYTGTPRTATVTAERQSVVREITEQHIAAVTGAQPELAAELHRNIARLLGKRLSRTTALNFAIDR